MSAEHFRPKSPQELTRQAIGNSDYVRELTGQSIIPPSFSPIESLGNMTSGEAKQVFGTKRWDIFTSVLRHELAGKDLPEEQEWEIGRTLRLLNNIDQYIADHHANPDTQVLWPKQMDAFEALGTFLKNGGTEGYLKLPTAFGKTVIFSELIKAANTKTLVVVPTIDLIEQTEDKIEQYSPNTPVGTVYSKSKNFGDQVTVITYNSLIKWVEERIPPEEAINFQPYDYDLVILDEAHHALGEQTQEALQAFPQAIKLGFTATPALADDRHLGEVLEHEIYSMSIKEAVAEGILAPFKVWLAESGIDLSNIDISKTSGDYGQRALARALNTPELNQKIADLCKANFVEDQGLAFCASVKHAKDLAELLKTNGIRAEAMYGGMDPKKRDEYQVAFKRGEIDVLCTKKLLTEGVDYPNASFVLNIAPTFSAKDEEQRGGRAERIDPLHPDKETTIVDFIYKDTRYAMSITFAEIAETARAGRRESFETSDGIRVQTGVNRTQSETDISIDGLKIITNVAEIMRLSSNAAKSRRPDVVPGGYSRIYTTALGNEYGVNPHSVLRLVTKLQKSNPEDILGIGAARSVYFITPEGEERLRSELVIFNPPEGYSVLAPGALAKELQVNKITVWAHMDVLSKQYPQHFIRRGKGRDIFISEEGLALLKSHIPAGTRVKEGYIALQGTHLTEKFGSQAVHRTIAKTGEAYPGDIIRQGKNRPVLLTRRGIKFILRDIQQAAKEFEGYVVFEAPALVSEYGITTNGAQKYFHDLQKLHPTEFLKKGDRGRLVMTPQGAQILKETMDAALKPLDGYERVDSAALALEYSIDRGAVTHQMNTICRAFPEEFKQNSRNKRIDFTPTAMLVLKDNLEKLRDVYSKEEVQATDFVPSKENLRNIFDNHIATTYAWRDEVLDELKKDHPELIIEKRNNRGAIITVVTDKDLFTQLMQARGARLRDISITPIQNTDFSLSSKSIKRSFGEGKDVMTIVNEVVAQMQAENPNVVVQRKQQGIVPAVTDRDLFIQLMESRGIKLRSSLVSATPKITDIDSMKQISENLSFGTTSSEYGSELWKRRATRYLTGMRTQAGLDANQIAARMNCDVEKVIKLETGEVTLEELQGDLPRKYAEAVGNPNGYNLYNLMFHLEFGIELSEAA